MSFRKPALISVLFSLGFGGFMTALALKGIPAKNHASYAVLAVDASYPDRRIGNMLPPDLAGGYISESTQWVFLDDFGTLKRIPLDEYPDRLEEFDPRNDGYGKKLRSFFVRDGKRLFFIPLAGGSIENRIKRPGFDKPDWGTIPVSDNWINKKQVERFEASLAASLGSIPFSIEFIGYEQPLLCYFLLFILASLGALILSDIPWFTATQLPVLGALVFAGPAGLALGAALIGLSGVLMALIRQLCACRWDGQGMKYPFVAPVLGSLLCMILLGLWVGMFWDMPGVFGYTGEGMLGLADQNTLEELGIPALLCVSCLLLLALWTESNRGRSQVYLLTSANRRAGNGTVIPFALVSLMALYIPSIMGIQAYHAPGPAADPRYFIDPADYKRHLAFQRSFSFIPLGLSRSDEDSRLGYARYRLGEDGLIAGSGEYASMYPLDENREIPPFPLEDLIAFLRDFKYTGPKNTGHIPAIPMMGLVPVLVVLGVYSMALFQVTQQGKHKHLLVYHDKRIAA
ncbi:MAG: hypothetical protein LBD55_06980 [Treponema sp.]|nr:hypothetical protein [Treponema sp.]